MLPSENKVKQVTTNNPCAMTSMEISGNNRAKAIQLLKQLKERERMANRDNKLSKLKYNKVHSDDLQLLLDKQMELQQRLGYDLKNMTISEVAMYCIYNKHCLEDELGEFMDALGGPAGNAAWKTWKASHEEMKKMKINELDDDCIIELKYEAIDILHFILNFFNAIQMDSGDVMGMYLAKNQENHDRQERKY